MLDIQTDNRGVATVTLNRPEVHNAFNEELIGKLIEAFMDLDKREDVRAVVVTGAGKSFSAGGDLNWMKAAADFTYEENVADAQNLGAMLHALYSLSKPTLALVNGAAFGGGVGLVAACDMAIATLEAKFCLSEVKLGLIPSVISPYVVEAMGKRQARRYFLTAEVFTGTEAKELGMVHHVVDSPDLLDEGAENLLSHLFKNAPGAVADAKTLIHDVSGAEIDKELVDYTAESIATRRATDEAKEGVAAFLEKRKASWIHDGH